MARLPAQHPESRHDGKKAAAASGAGAVAGVLTSAGIGGVGITVAGTGVGLGVVPFAVVGGVFGLAAYGIYRAFRK